MLNAVKHLTNVEMSRIRSTHKQKNERDCEAPLAEYM